MTQLHDTTRISRRKVLAGLGAVGVASAGAGLGTVGFFSDRETLPADLTAGRLDLKLDYRATYTPGEYRPTDSDGTPYPVGDMTTDERTGQDRSTYVVGMAPDLRNRDTTVVDGATWSAANLALDACVPLGDQLPLDVDGDESLDVFAGNAKRDGDALDNYSVGYVNGGEGVLFGLTDVKPGDRGETTISFHVCDNPAFVWLEATGEDDENTRYEPEAEAGDTGTGPFAGGELDEFLWVRAFYDPDCSNTLGEDERVFYEGSLAGFLEATTGGFALDPFSDDVATTGTTTQPSTGELLGVETIVGNPTCADVGGSLGTKFETGLDSLGSTTHTTSYGDITVTITELKDGNEGLTLDWSAPFEIDHVLVKGGNAANVYTYDGARSGQGLTTPGGKGISHVTFCYDVPVTTDTPPDPNPPSHGFCYEPGTHCIAVEWYFPSRLEQPDGMGFAQLPSDAIETDTPVNGAFPSLADELLSRFDLGDVSEIDGNVAQSDVAGFVVTLAAVQCRHNMDNANPFASVDSAETTTP